MKPEAENNGGKTSYYDLPRQCATDGCTSLLWTNSRHQKWCRSCIKVRQREQNAAHYQRKREAAGVVPIGGRMPCAGACGKEIVRDAPARRFCPECSSFRHSAYTKSNRPPKKTEPSKRVVERAPKEAPKLPDQGGQDLWATPAAPVVPEAVRNFLLRPLTKG